VTTSRHDMRHGRQGGRIVDYETRAVRQEREQARARAKTTAPIFTTLAAADVRARATGGSVVKVPGSESVWAVFPPDRSPEDLPNWFPPHPTARASDPGTSHTAAARASVRAATDRALVLRIHQQWTAGLTDFELAELAGRQQTSLGVRRGDLRKAGLIRDSGLKRPAPSGSPATVWIITEEGRAIDAGRPIDLEQGAA
jgi:hypothetical protein